MDILYLSSYPSNYFKNLLNHNRKSSSLPSQKFNSLLAKGFINNDVKVTVISSFNHLKWYENNIFIRSELINAEGIDYIFLPMVKIKVIDRVFTHLVIKNFVKVWCKKHKEGAIVIDILKPYSHIFARYSKGNSIVSVVTDLPEHILESKSIIDKILNLFKMRNYSRLFKNSTHFVFLTELMNIKLNSNNKPYCIIEGLVDSSMDLKYSQYKLQEKKICLYSGALHKKYGVENLVRAFMLEELKNYELHLYGSGDYEEELSNIIIKYHNIKFFGSVDNNIVVEKQMEATILINPRPSNEEFTKYSFPSKNLEYMVTGRPVLTTHLPGMPDEYLDYVYIINDESIIGIAKEVTNILKKDNEILKKKGESARNFVLNQKNNTIQARRIFEMLKSKD